MSVFILISLISTFVCAISAAIVFYSNRRARVNRFFAASSLVLSFSAFSEFMYRQASDLPTALIWTKVNMAAFCSVVLFICFIFEFAERPALLKHAAVIILIYVPTLVFIVLGLGTDLVTGDPLRTAMGFVTFRVPPDSLLYYCFNVWFLLQGIFLCIFLIVFFKTTANAKKKSQAKYFVIGMLPMIASGIVELVLAAVGILIPSMFTAGLVWFNLCVAYAVRNQDLFEMDAASAAENIIAAMPDPLLLADVEETVVRVNPSFQIMFACREEDVIGRSCRTFFTDTAAADRVIGSLATGRFLESTEVELQTASGAIVSSLVSGSVVRDRRRRAWGFFLIVHDITGRKKSEKALQRLASDLERSNRELETFARAASHDLQEPLRKILIYSDLLLRADSGPTGRAEDHVRRITDAAHRMRHLIEGLLGYSRVSSVPPSFSPVDLNRVLAETLVDLEIALGKTGGSVEADPLPTVRADPLLIQQLFQNLIGNALKYHRPDVPPVVRIKAAVTDKRVTLRFSDNGIGFDNQYSEDIFGIFRRLVGKTDYEGAGIGLAICKKIAETHGGTIRADGVLGQGSVFTVELPLS
jgi:PAS domain S-box-containing protein